MPATVFWRKGKRLFKRNIHRSVTEVNPKGMGLPGFEKFREKLPRTVGETCVEFSPQVLIFKKRNQ